MKKSTHQSMRKCSLLVQVLVAAAIPLSAVTATADVWDDALALYRFDNNLLDSNGENHGIGKKGESYAVTSPVFTNVGEEDRPGWTGNALVLNGTRGGRYVDLGQGEDGALQLVGDMTLFIRVLLDEDPNTTNPALISKYGFDSSDRSYSLRLSTVGDEDGGTMTLSLNGTYSQSYTSENIKAGGWMDLAVVFEAANRVSFYLNGENVLTTHELVPSYIINNSTVPLLIGAQPYFNPAATTPPGIGTSGLDGMVETAAIWNRALSDREVMSLSVAIPEPSTTFMLLSVGGGLLYSLARNRGFKSNQNAKLPSKLEKGGQSFPLL